MPQPAPATFKRSQRALASSLRRDGKKDLEVKAALLAEAEKCDYCWDEADWVEYGGAISFAEYDAWQEADRTEWAARELTWAFEGIVDNIFRRDDLSLPTKASMIEAAARDMGTRVTSPNLTDDKEERGILAKAKSWLGGNASAVPNTHPATITPAASKAENSTSAPAPPSHDEHRPGMFRAYKDAAGDWRWFAVYSNHFKDDEGEWFPYHAHKAFIAELDGGQAPMPELWLWHTPGTRAGIADVVDLTTEGFMVAGGTFDNGKEAVAEALALDPDLGVSHGFVYDVRAYADGAYNRYWTYEISPLPHGKAANKLTSFTGLEVAGMFTAEKKDWLAAHGMPGDVLTTIERGLEGIAAKAHEHGISFKELAAAFKEEAVSVGVGAPAAPASPSAADIAAAVAATLRPELDALASRVSEQAEEIKSIKAGTGDPDWTPRVVGAQGYQATREGGLSEPDVPEATRDGLKVDSAEGVPPFLKEHFAMLGGLAAAGR